MSANEGNARKMLPSEYTIETVKLAMALAELNKPGQILRLLASSLYGVSSAVKMKDLLHCLAEVLGPEWTREVEGWIEGKEPEGP